MGLSQAKFIIGLVLAILIAVGVSVFFQDYRSAKQAAAQNETRGQVLQNTSAGVTDGIEIDEAQAAYAQGLADARATFQQAKEEAKRNEPETASRAARRVPVSVRNAARERRLARERLGCAGRECEEGR